MRVSWLPDRLRDFGLDVVEVDGWKMRGSSMFEPEAVLVHHTASPKGREVPSLGVCVNGRSDLPGPLCNVLIGRGGRCYLIASGRANHAGKGTWQGLSGNTAFLGIEAENDGRGEPWTPQLMDAFHRATAALLVGIGKGPIFAAGHKEYALPKGRKSDPNFDMAEFRAAVGLDIQWWHNREDDDMTPEQDQRLKAIEQQLEEVANAVAGFDTQNGKRADGSNGTTRVLSWIGKIGEKTGLKR